ncbi:MULTISPECIES: DUF305 domain-containing protein [unclassified Paenarthrobacter]|uniref:DUF305 domain-containing protein n=1 Tax=unclassified Paenarthrobacter TaxID=2634190 RepID=UPI00084E63EA|nr:DUF305 domain-containing protein [Paenarthrobacter sp. R1]NKR10623.1 DUF305 domain-containing protein [Arthrobacter sp. M5]NKR16464.1 DUF305 domain-containing protein [Arthrobacter sp. M6]OEH61426.1 DUF305 domain-containing protein [Arthrobacter sp. D4]OEH64412.1 DUF305 domain-containing protein [Arthrobacter sp. D2]WIV29197.1 DUF305 domain-containing protein [Paenarthrobacter sp. R1]
MNEDTTAPAGSEAPEPAKPGPRPLTGRLWLVLLTVLVLTAAAFFAVGRLTAGPAPVSDAGPDAGFARDMQAHHAQAVEMALLIRDKSANEEIRTIAYDIITTQQQQSGQMFAWLVDWGLPQAGSVPPMAWMGTGEHGGNSSTMGQHPGSESGMEGMATPEQLQKLRGAAGAEADRLFIELMIRHHQGGVAMARAAASLAETAKVRDFAAGIVEAQTAEITALQELRGRL